MLESDQLEKTKPFQQLRPLDNLQEPVPDEKLAQDSLCPQNDTSAKRQNETVDPSLFSLHLIEGRVIADWKKFISSGENIIRFLGDYIAKHIRQNKACHL
jgi:hypothetical protein